MLTNSDLQGLKHLIYLELNGNQLITDEGLKHLNLEVLYLNRINIINILPNLGDGYAKITNEGIQHMTNMKILDASWSNITNDGIKNMKLHSLFVHGNENITEEGIRHMYETLKVLDIGFDMNYNGPNITDVIMKTLHLTHLSIVRNNKITLEGIKHMNLVELWSTKSAVPMLHI